MAIVAVALLAACSHAAHYSTLPGQALHVEPSAFEQATDVSLRRSQLPIVVDASRMIAHRVTAALRLRGFKVVNPYAIAELHAEHPTWTTAAEIGAGVGARFVIRVYVKSQEPFRADIHVVECWPVECGQQVYVAKVKSEAEVYQLFLSAVRE